MLLAGCWESSTTYRAAIRDDAGPDGAVDDAEVGTESGADGASDASGAPQDAACGCINDLSNVAGADFYVSFRIATTSTAQAPLVNQRAECDALKPFWAVAMLSNGQIEVETNDGMGNYGTMHSTATVNDGASHHVLVSRKGIVLAVSIDGQTISADVSQAVLGPMAPVQVGTESACSAPPLVGTVTDLCITSPCLPGN